MRVNVQSVDGRGLVWDAEGALELRRQHRIVGQAAGSVAGFKQQVSAQGLPVVLSPDEVTLAVRKGLISLFTVEVKDLALSASPQPGNEQIEEPQEWRDALANRSIFNIPLHHQSATGLTDNRQAEWHYPASQEEADRFLVFQDLHAQGFYLTEGSKFGADLLVYPGDPVMYHALYCVRIIAPQQPIVPAHLAGAARGSHAARKHLLWASVMKATDSHPAHVNYITFAPASEFGT